ncbi:methyl-accepting chemotaxis protein [Aureimonas ureilytica]|uniref:methyl-accepting chemotaxis protein n=1 Tax=Aureimonas ureilytica TaxID=401562 RepID=UPI00039E23CB|nr:CHASE3 domain-containing protein [Aureimonas ureilytica]
MFSMSKLRLKAKITLLFSIVAVITVSAIGFIHVGRTTLSDTMRWNDHTYEVVNQIDQIVEGMVDQETAVRGYMITGAEANLEPYRSGLDMFTRALDRAVALTADNPVQQSRLLEVRDLARRWAAQVAEPAMAFMADPDTRQKAWDLEISSVGKRDMDQIRAVTAQIVATERSLLAERQEKAAAAEEMIKWAIGGGLAGMILALIGAGIVLVRATCPPLQRAVELAQAISQGDLTQSAEVRGRDEVADLLRAMNAMRETLRGTIEDVITSAQQVAAGSQLSASTSEQLSQSASEQAASTEQLGRGTSEQALSAQQLARGLAEQAVAAERLSQGAIEQAAATEQASAAMEEMSANIRQTAENATTTEKIAAQASQNTKRSGQAVVSSLEAMRTIAGKIRIVQEIARQTDLLALNAAIEAARAGQHGKGFAVVASEVRKLAERSQGAASEISELAASTLHISEEAGRMLELLVPDIERTAELVAEISAACREQHAGAEQINQAIQQLDQVTQQTSQSVQQLDTAAQQNAEAVRQLDEIAQQNAVAVQQLDEITQQNAAASNEMSTTAEQLSAEALRLTDRVSFFQLGEGVAVPAPRQETPKAPAAPTVRALQARVDRFVASRPSAPAASAAPVRETKPLPERKAPPVRSPSTPVARGGIALDLGPDDQVAFERLSS